uniref:SV_SVC-Lyc-3 n=1 Tax=Lychas buchari TaxID=1330406 RepID=T1DPB3_9SCOR
MIRCLLVLVTCFLVAVKLHEPQSGPYRSPLMALVAPTCEPELDGLKDECVDNATIRNICYGCFHERLNKIYNYCCHKYNNMFEWCQEYFAEQQQQ